MFIRSVNAVPPAGDAAQQTSRAAEAKSRGPAASVPDEAALREAVAAANKAMRAASSSVEFVVDSSTNKTVVRIIDQATKEVIRQIPSEEMIAIARGIDRLQGLLLKGKA